jgi:hypothetical protein
LPYSTAQSKR